MYGNVSPVFGTSIVLLFSILLGWCVYVSTSEADWPAKATIVLLGAYCSAVVALPYPNAPPDWRKPLMNFSDAMRPPDAIPLTLTLASAFFAAAVFLRLTAPLALTRGIAIVIGILIADRVLVLTEPLQPYFEPVIQYISHVVGRVS